jgi:hypothetical protein
VEVRALIKPRDNNKNKLSWKKKSQRNPTFYPNNSDLPKINPYK